MADVTTRLLLVDDDALVRSGLALILGGTPDLEVVGQAGDGDEALRLIPELRPDVVLMDIRMPTLDGVEATRVLKERGEEPRIVVLTTFGADEHVVPLGGSELTVGIVGEIGLFGVEAVLDLGRGGAEVVGAVVGRDPLPELSDRGLERLVLVELRAVPDVARIDDPVEDQAARVLRVHRRVDLAEVRAVREAVVVDLLDPEAAAQDVDVLDGLDRPQVREQVPVPHSLLPDLEHSRPARRGRANHLLGRQQTRRDRQQYV